MPHHATRLAALAALCFTLAGCAGGNAGADSAVSPAQIVLGVATPSSVAVVTAKNAQ